MLWFTYIRGSTNANKSINTTAIEITCMQFGGMLGQKSECIFVFCQVLVRFSAKLVCVKHSLVPIGSEEYLVIMCFLVRWSCLVQDPAP